MRTQKLTTKDLTGAFGVTPMTITNWRAGTPTRTPLPCEKSGRSVHYRPAAVRKWAERNGVPLLDPLKLLGGAERVKPGPKPQPQEESP